ncbi:MAG: adenylyltransferase/cytidyltransferase family protein [bacterium]|nr:adenylyltransferase/cytidyltransferase family protein [bacterium]
MQMVVVFGVFDLLHLGHLYFLKEARKYGDHLTVVVTRDARVIHEKKHKSLFSERERLEMVAALKAVDRAVLGDRVGEWRVLKKLQPDTVCVGYDQKQTIRSLNILRKLPRIIRIKALQPKKYKSSKYVRH